jgi:hypothetical protein
VKVKRTRRIIPVEDTISVEIMENRGFTDKELACVPFFIKWRIKKPDSQARLSRFSDRDAAANWLARCGERDYEVIEHNIELAEAA